MKHEASLQRFLRKLKQKNFFNEIEYDKLYPSGSAPARIYGTPKMHIFFSSESFPKLRPVVSSKSTFNYNLASFLCDRFSPLVPNDYFCKDTFSFVSQIKNANLSKKYLVFYDVTSLFTNIPLQETIYIAINLIFNHHLNLNITREELKKNFLFATSQTQEHIKKYIKSHFFKHLHSTATCIDSYNSLCFKIIDKVNSKFDLKIKEAVNINCGKCTTKPLSSHRLTIASVSLTPFCLCLFFLLLFFAFLFNLLFLLSLR